MKQRKHFYLLSALALVIAAAPPARGQIFWTGPTTNFNKTASGQSDAILTKSVVLTRGGNQVLYNTAAGETSASHTNSPVGAEWAFGELSNYNTLSFSSMEALRNNAGGDLSLYMTNQPMVLHLVNSNIYLSVFFVSWQMQGGDFNYIRSTPSVAAPTPTVSITNPVNGATFTAPANVTIQASASVGSGSVTNVRFFSGTILLGSATSAPFTFADNNLAAGTYNLTAVATAGGVSATSAVVNITVVTPVVVTNSAPSVAGGHFSFNYTATAGLVYVIEGSSDLVNWTPLATNTPSSGSATFTDTSGLGPRRFYEVVLPPNP